MSAILEVENISKKFKIYHNKQPYLSLRDTIIDIIKHPSKVFQSDTEEFWALKDINFTVNEGESIGIIGKNGAGKSTLLKILSRITPPTKGKITLRGRVASLLEVGTGFHPELTGRENVFFNGSILGMKRKEIQMKFDEIVAFAGVEKFIDTPLKHYSSGMQLRLAFAVAAFLEAEILVVDEVLAVGDAEFQKKCLGKMEDVTKKEGRTVLFVSHNMGAVQNLCSRGILLEKGKLIFDGKVENAIGNYLSYQLKEAKSVFEINENFLENEGILEKIEILDSQDNLKQRFSIGEKFKLRMHFTFLNDIKNVIIGIGFLNELDIPFRTVWTKPLKFNKGKCIVEFEEKELCYGKGIYSIILGLSIQNITFYYREKIAQIEFSEECNIPEIVNVKAAGIIVNPITYKIIQN